MNSASYEIIPVKKSMLLSAKYFRNSDLVCFSSYSSFKTCPWKNVWLTKCKASQSKTKKSEAFLSEGNNMSYSPKYVFKIVSNFLPFQFISFCCSTRGQDTLICYNICRSDASNVPSIEGLYWKYDYKNWVFSSNFTHC